MVASQNYSALGSSTSSTSSSKKGSSSSTTTVVDRKNHRIVRNYLGTAAYERRVIKELLTEDEARAHCMDNNAASMTCSTKHGRRRTRRIGHWFDTFEQYR
jgi:hypothetical protein